MTSWIKWTFISIASLFFCSLLLLDQKDNTWGFLFHKGEPQKKQYVNIYIWAGYLPLRIIKQFEEETGIKVIVDFYESNQILEAKLLMGGSGYDIVFPNVWPFAERHIKLDLYQPLDLKKIPNSRHLSPDIMAYMAQADRGNRYLLPLFWGVTGIGYNPTEIQKKVPGYIVDSWSALFDPRIVKQFSSCGVHLLDEITDLYGSVLIYLGYDPDNPTPAQIEKALTILKKVRPFIRRFGAYRSVSELESGEACLIQNWSSDVGAASLRMKRNQQAQKIQFAIPKEGTLLWIDSIAIPKDAPHIENAHKFLNFLMRPHIIAHLSNTIGFANASIAARVYLKREIRESPTLYPDLKSIKKLYTSGGHSLKMERYLVQQLMKLRANRL